MLPEKRINVRQEDEWWREVGEKFGEYLELLTGDIERQGELGIKKFRWGVCEKFGEYLELLTGNIEGQGKLVEAYQELAKMSQFNSSVGVNVSDGDYEKNKKTLSDLGRPSRIMSVFSLNRGKDRVRVDKEYLYDLGSGDLVWLVRFVHDCVRVDSG